MDPDVTYLRFCGACDDHDDEAVLEYAGHLAAWLDNGGFEPDWTKHQRVYRDRFEELRPHVVRAQAEKLHAVTVLLKVT